MKVFPTNSLCCCWVNIGAFHVKTCLSYKRSTRSFVFWHNIVIIGVGRGRPGILRKFEKCWDGPPHYFYYMFDELKSITHCNNLSPWISDSRSATKYFFQNLSNAACVASTTCSEFPSRPRPVLSIAWGTLVAVKL